MEQNKKQKIYIAGKVEEGKENIQSLADELEERGHVITCKWWQKDIKKPYLDRENIKESTTSSIEMEDGIRDSDVFILVPNPSILGAAIEIGIAIGDNKDREILVVVDQDTRQSIFYVNPKVVCLESLAAIRQRNWF